MDKECRNLAKEALRAASGESRIRFNLSIFKNNIILWIDDKSVRLIRSKYTPSCIKKALGKYFLHRFVKNQRSIFSKN